MPPKDIKKSRLVSVFPEFSPLKVKFKDVFSMKDFYEEFWNWLKEEGWKDWESDMDTFERFYGERVGQGGVKELWIRWRPYKIPQPYGGKKPPLRFFFDIDFHVIGLTSAEIVKDGKKIKTEKGELEITVRAFVEKAYEEEFEKHGLLKHLLDIFTGRIYRLALEERKKELYREAYVLQTFIKQWFKMKTHLPYEEVEGFFPSKAYPSHQ